MGRLSALFVSIVLVPWLAAAQDPQRPEYPEGSAIPRHRTPEEAAWMLAHPREVPDAVTPPPTGPVHCPAEYEPMEGILLAWEGPRLWWLELLRDITRHVTTIGNAYVYIAVDSVTERTSAANFLAAGGVNLGRVNFVVRGTNTIWIRDFGPRYIYQGDCRAIVDHTYDLPRALDNAYPSAFAEVKNHALYELPLRHFGGNYHLDALGRGRATRLIVHENPELTEPQIHGIWEDYQNVDTTFYEPLPRSVDGTQHIDMWMQIIADDAVFISDWPFNPGSIQDLICDGAAMSMAAQEYTVHRLPARHVDGVHYTYTNVVMCNDLVLIPSYTHPSVAPHNSEALAAWQAALPSKTIVPLDCEFIAVYSGVLHCIVMHLPAHRGGLDPTSYLVNLNGGEVLVPGTQAEIRWITDDDVAVQNVDLLLSTDGGGTYPTALALQIPDSGSYLWTVPDLCTGLARIRVVARDHQGRTGSDDTDGFFTVNGTGCSATSISYGAGTAGQGGVVPSLASTVPLLGSALTLDIRGARPGSASLLIVGAAPTSVPFYGATLLVEPAGHVLLPISAAGAAAVGFNVPPEPALTGISLYWQDWVADPAAAGGLATTSGLETRFGL